MPASRLIVDADGLGWVVECGTGRLWRIVTEIELGFVGSDRREPTEAEQAESAKHNYMGTARTKTDPWDHASPLGRTSAIHVAQGEGLRLLRQWHD